MPTPRALLDRLRIRRAERRARLAERLKQRAEAGVQRGGARRQLTDRDRKDGVGGGFTGGW